MLRIADLDPSEIRALATCNHVSEFNGIREGKVVKLARADFTCLQRLLKCLHLGKFATTEMGLSQIARHLGEYDWKPAIQADPHSDLYRAYLKVCFFANHAMACGGYSSHYYDSLYHNVSQAIAEVPVMVHGKPAGSQTVYWNPALRYGHIVDYVQNTKLYWSMVVIRGEHYSADPEWSTLVSRERLPDTKIYSGRLPAVI
jgi:hypothetical protein